MTVEQVKEKLQEITKCEQIQKKCVIQKSMKEEVITMTCKDCTNRHSACHDTCEVYKKWKAEKDKIKKVKDKEKFIKIQMMYYNIDKQKHISRRLK